MSISFAWIKTHRHTCGATAADKSLTRFLLQHQFNKLMWSNVPDIGNRDKDFWSHLRTCACHGLLFTVDFARLCFYVASWSLGKILNVVKRSHKLSDGMLAARGWLWLALPIFRGWWLVFFMSFNRLRRAWILDLRVDSNHNVRYSIKHRLKNNQYWQKTFHLLLNGQRKRFQDVFVQIWHEVSEVLSQYIPAFIQRKAISSAQYNKRHTSDTSVNVRAKMAWFILYLCQAQITARYTITA